MYKDAFPLTRDNQRYDEQVALLTCTVRLFLTLTLFVLVEPHPTDNAICKLIYIHFLNYRNFEPNQRYYDDSFDSKEIHTRQGYEQ